MPDKKEQLKWLLNNVDKVEIGSVYYDGVSGNPTLLIEFQNWDLAELSPFETDYCCIVFE